MHYYNQVKRASPFFVFRTNIRQLVSANLRKVTPQKQTTDRMLNTATHFHQVFKNVPHRSIFTSKVNGSNRAKKISDSTLTAIASHSFRNSDRVFETKRIMTRQLYSRKIFQAYHISFIWQHDYWVVDVAILL